MEVTASFGAAASRAPGGPISCAANPPAVASTAMRPKINDVDAISRRARKRARFPAQAFKPPALHCVFNYE